MATKQSSCPKDQVWRPRGSWAVEVGGIRVARRGGPGSPAGAQPDGTGEALVIGPRGRCQDLRATPRGHGRARAPAKGPCGRVPGPLEG